MGQKTGCVQRVLRERHGKVMTMKYVDERGAGFLSVIIVAVLFLGGMEYETHAQTVIQVPFDTAVFAWDLPAASPTASVATKHTIVCGAVTVDVPMPATSIPVRTVVPGIGTYSCSIYASNAFGRQAAANVPFAQFEAGLVPLAPANPRLEVR